MLSRVEDSQPVQGEIRYLDTATAYDLWSEVYDTDGNFLQALDSLEVRGLLSTLLGIMLNDRLNIVDLGCGTGRNTLQLLDCSSKRKLTITAVDLSPKMLDIARSRCEKQTEIMPHQPQMKFKVFDMTDYQQLPDTEYDADLVLSTLVLEHVPLAVFMQTVTTMLKPGGYLLLTNMHSQMGGISQAGFVDVKTGAKIRPTSYAHTVEETIEAAMKSGLNCVSTYDEDEWKIGQAGALHEVAVTEKTAERLGPRAKKWVGVNVWYGGIFLKV